MGGICNCQEVDDAFTLAKTLWGSDQDGASFYMHINNLKELVCFTDISLTIANI